MEGTLSRSRSVLTALLVVPQGVEAMNVDFPGLVQTSLNMGVMHMDGEGVHFALSVRSCIASQKEMLLQRIGAIIELAGGTARYSFCSTAANAVIKASKAAALAAGTPTTASHGRRLRHRLLRPQ